MVAFAALPTSPTSYVLAVRMGGHGAYVAGLVTVSTLLAMPGSAAGAGRVVSAALSAGTAPSRCVHPAAHRPPAAPRATPVRSRHRRRAARCPARPRGCGASVQDRCGAMRCLAVCAGTTLRPSCHSVEQLRRVPQVARIEVGETRALRVLVPRAHELAIVAAVDAVAHQRPQLQRYGAVVLDGQVGDAPPRIEPVRRRRWPASGRRRCRHCSCRNARRSVRSAARAGRRRSRRERTSSRPRATARACVCRASRCRCVAPAPLRAPAPNR